MASFPRCPLASGSNIDGPTGSSTTASSAKSANHPSRSLASVESHRLLGHVECHTHLIPFLSSTASGAVTARRGSRR